MEADDRLLVERMLDTRVAETEVDLNTGPSGGEVVTHFFALGVRHILGAVTRSPAVPWRAAARCSPAARCRHDCYSVHRGALRSRWVWPCSGSSRYCHHRGAADRRVNRLGRPRKPGAASVGFSLASSPSYSVLVHGLGFARALQELGIGSSGAGVALPLGCFNLGVEAGQSGSRSCSGR